MFILLSPWPQVCFGFGLLCDWDWHPCFKLSIHSFLFFKFLTRLPLTAIVVKVQKELHLWTKLRSNVQLFALVVFSCLFDWFNLLVGRFMSFSWNQTLQHQRPRSASQRLTQRFHRTCSEFWDSESDAAQTITTSYMFPSRERLLFSVCFNFWNKTFSVVSSV